MKADLGQLAIQRGPLVYCLEACDQGEPLASLYLPAERGAEGREADRPARRRRGREGTGRDGRGAGLDEHAVPADRAVVARCRSRRSPTTPGTTASPGAMKVWLPSRAADARGRRPGDAGEGEPVVRQRQLPAVGHQRRPGAARAAASSPPRSATGGPITAATNGSSTPGRSP